MELSIEDWTFRAVVTEGEPLELGGSNIWLERWNCLDVGVMQVPHPGYPLQRHKLWIYSIEKAVEVFLFAAGELSNGVWCFYLPAKGQPAQRCKGMTVNERLVTIDVSSEFARAISGKEQKRSIDILISTGLTRDQATRTVNAVLANPGDYGYA